MSAAKHDRVPPRNRWAILTRWNCSGSGTICRKVAGRRYWTPWSVWSRPKRHSTARRWRMKTL